MVALSVNVNKVALLRNQRHEKGPSVVGAAEAVLAAGAHGITVHPRPDERHIRPQDVEDLGRLLAGYEGVEYNIEGYPSEAWLTLVERMRPAQATLVPDGHDVVTSDQGWDVVSHRGLLSDVAARLGAAGVRVSLFVETEAVQIEAAAGLGVQRIELYTGPYAEDGGCLPRYVEAAECARDCDLGVNAGHDLTHENLGALVGSIPWLEEVSIGHALVGHALWVGWERAVGDYLAACRPGPA